MSLVFEVSNFYPSELDPEETKACFARMLRSALVFPDPSDRSEMTRWSIVRHKAQHEAPIIPGSVAAPVSEQTD